MTAADPWAAPAAVEVAGGDRLPRTGPLAPADRLLAACRRQPVDCTPVWFMRQAGRSLAGYRELRERYGFLEMARMPELCTRVTLMPVGELGVDGAVLYADIMLPLEGMGVALEIQPDVGPIIEHPVRTREAVEELRPLVPEESVPYVLEALRQVRAALSGGQAAVIGFAGAPFTLACYLIEGRPTRDYALARSLLLRDPPTWAALMDRLTESTVRYLRAQVAAGAQVVQVFDSWVGALAPDDFERSVLPWMQRLFDEVRQTSTPTIYFGTATSALLPLIARAGSDVVSVDWRVALDTAWSAIGTDRGIQGNLDPARVLAGWEPALAGARAVLAQAAGRPGHIFNLGHGVLPASDPSVLARLVEAVHAESAR